MENSPHYQRLSGEELMRRLVFIRTKIVNQEENLAKNFSPRVISDFANLDCLQINFRF